MPIIPLGPSPTSCDTLIRPIGFKDFCISLKDLGNNVSSRAFATVLKSFTDEAERAFSFLAREFGFSGPDRHTIAMPAVAFARSGLIYRVGLDTDDRAVITRVEMDLGKARLVAELSNLVSAAGLGPGNQVAYSAHTLRSLRRALESQAGFVRLLQPLLTGAEAESLMLKAKARKWQIH